jgi:hypothetical protein
MDLPGGGVYRYAGVTWVGQLRRFPLPAQSLAKFGISAHSSTAPRKGIASIIESHHGRLWGEPNEGPGATLSFSVPRPPEGETGVRDLDATRTLAGTAS